MIGEQSWKMHFGNSADLDTIEGLPINKTVYVVFEHTWDFSYWFITDNKDIEKENENYEITETRQTDHTGKLVPNE